MPGINNNLYPPIFRKSYAPAFVRSQGCKVYFSISIYNSYDQILESHAQVVVQNQKTNQSVLNKTSYPSGIKICPIQIDSSAEREEQKYYITITNADIDGGFNFNEYYKVQIRFTSDSCRNLPNLPSSSVGIDSWLNSNLSNFSQWSTVILIKPISDPNLSLRYFDLNASSSVITTNHLTIAGSVSQLDGDYEDYRSYKLLIYDQGEELLEDSGDLYFVNPGQINYNCKYNFQSGEKYKLKIQVLTRNLYLKEWNTDFEVNYVPYTTFDAVITAKIDNFNGCAIITLKNEITTALGTNIVIRRASSNDNFHYWEDMYTTLIPANTMINFTWKDYTIESGVWYKYSAVKRNKQNFRSTSVEINDPILANFEDIFLTTGQNQLKIKFDPQITNYSRVVSESLTETIGSKYPFIRRNGNVGYRTFSIAGTISYFSDIDQNLMHASRQETYGESATLYNQYNKDNNINLYNDIIQEKVFREKVIDFLYQNNVKLYRSATQGNILVKLMNISFTPNATLSRQIYNFTCTAYEIDQFTYQNCIKYNIQSQGAYTQEEKIYIERHGQLMAPPLDKYYEETGNMVSTEGKYFGSQDLLRNNIKQKYKNLQTNQVQIDINKITYLRITLTSDPYPIGISGNQPYKITDNNTEDAIYLGHIAIINGQYIIIGKNGIYQLSEEDTGIDSLSFVDPNEQGVIDFEVSIEESTKNSENMVRKYSIFSKIGQLWGNFNIASDNVHTVYTDIIDKYTISNQDQEEGFSQQVQRIAGLRITADPGTVIYVRERQDSGYEKHILNDTGLLEFYDDDTDIRGIYFIGPELTEVTKESVEENGLRPYEFYDSKEVITFDSVKDPKNNYVYYVPSFDPEDSSTLVIPNTQLEQIEETLYLSQAIQQQMTNYVWNTDKDSVEEVDEETLGLVFPSYKRYIFHNGQWYPFTNQNTLEVSYIEAVVDYYCDILRREY